jgi:hypothetical protein
MLGSVDWSKYGVEKGVVKDPRCENCMTHCGYEPTASLGRNAEKGDMWKNIVFNFSPKPKPAKDGSLVQPYTGVGSGNGHLTGRQAQEETSKVA